MLHKHEDPNLIVNIYIGYHGGSTWKRKAPHFLVNQKAMEENDFVIHILSFFFYSIQSHSVWDAAIQGQFRSSTLE